MENDTIKLLLLEGIDIDSDKSSVNNINDVLECSIFLINHHLGIEILKDLEKDVCLLLIKIHQL